LEGVHFFWSDERCVAADNPESNFRLANEFLFRQVAVPPEQIHRLRGEMAPREAAALGGSELRQFTNCPPPKVPQIDLVLLGMGEDGHTASLHHFQHYELFQYQDQVAESPITTKAASSASGLR
jgi:6-phosphogluconolactonase